VRGFGGIAISAQRSDARRHPGVGRIIRAREPSDRLERIALTALLLLLAAFWHQVGARVEPRHRAGRLKQWLGYLRHTYPQAQTLFVFISQ
jgi:tRNA-dihydrouridine synthase C